MTSSGRFGAQVRTISLGTVGLGVLLVTLATGTLTWHSLGLDNDLYYHLNAGRYIVAHRALPTEAFFSYLVPPRHWVDYYWLFQTVVFAFQRALGDYGLVVFRAATFLGTLAFVFGLLRGLVAGSERSLRRLPILPVALTAIYALALLPRFASVRPHTTTLLAIALSLYLLENWPRRPWILVALTLVWMNLHGIAYPIMWLVFGSYVVDFAWDRTIPRRPWTPEDVRRLLWLLGAMAMFLLTPHGITLLTLPFRSIAVASRYILEIRPVDPATLFVGSLGPEGFAPQTALNFLRVLILVAIALLAVRRQLRPHHLLLVAGGVALLIKGARFEYHLVLLGLPALAAVSAGWQVRLESRRVTRALAAAVVLLGAYSATAYFRQQRELVRPYGAHGAPRGVAIFLASRGDGGRVLHHPNLGGYLAWKLYPRYRITADMQTPFVFSDADVFRSIKVFNNEVLLRGMLDQYEPPYVIAPLGNFGFARFVTERLNFVPVFFDEISALYVSRAALPEQAATYAIKGLDMKRGLVDQIDDLDADRSRAALADVERMLEIDPRGGLLRLLAARLRLRAGDPQLAARDAADAVRLMPGSFEAHAALGDVAFARQDWEAAAKAYRRAVALAPEEHQPSLYRRLGRSLGRLERHRAAYAAMLRAIDVLSSDTSRADLYELALSARAAGKTDEAREYLGFAALQTPPGDLEWKRRIDEALATLAR